MCERHQPQVVLDITLEIVLHTLVVRGHQSTVLIITEIRAVVNPLLVVRGKQLLVLVLVMNELVMDMVAVLGHMRHLVVIDLEMKWIAQVTVAVLGIQNRLRAVLVLVMSQPATVILVARGLSHHTIVLNISLMNRLATPRAVVLGMVHRVMELLMLTPVSDHMYHRQQTVLAHITTIIVQEHM